MSSPSSPEGAGLPPAAMLAIHLDLVGGISGDMFVAAMIDALPMLAAPVLRELAVVCGSGEAAPDFREASSGGLRAKRFGLTPATGPKPLRAPSLKRVRANAAGAQRHGGTSYANLRGRVADAPLTTATRTHALALLALLAEAEASVHGTSVDEVHFHELADWDSLMDVVAVGCIAGALSGAHWSASAAPLGGGTVRTAHGLLPVPAPATGVLLTGYRWHDDGIAGERVTPTGAAILRYLVPASRCGARRDAGRLIAVGCGAGTRSLPGLPNILRALVLERTASSGLEKELEVDAVVVLEFDVDDMTGEEIALAADRLRAVPGVLDLSVGVRQGKKGRPVIDFRLLSKPEAADAAALSCFNETSTLGLRLRDERRRVLQRSEVDVAVDGTALRVKLASRPDGAQSAKTAADDLVSTPGHGARRRTRAAAERTALKGGRK